MDVGSDVCGEARVDLVQDVLAVVERPHLPNRLVADPRHNATDVIEHRVDSPALGKPVFLRGWKLWPDRAAFPGIRVDERHDVARLVLVRHVVDARPDVHDRLERRMGGHVLDALSVDPDLSSVADRFAVLVAGAYHASPPFHVPARRLSVGSGLLRRSPEL